jgi:hypothetical protein
LQISSSVEKRTAFALPLFKMLKLAMVMLTRSLNSVKLIFLRANITSRFTTIGILNS